MTQGRAKKKLIYIMGCGRSGTTILGVALGNGHGCLDLGEAVDFLKRRGVPNSYGPETDTGQFWAAVTGCLAKQEEDIFDDGLVDRLSRLEYHYRFPLSFLGLNGKSALLAYSAYINSLFGCISRNAPNASVYIDTSKYPGRASLLMDTLRDFDVCILHIVRHPVKTVESFGDRGKRDDQGYKGFIAANFYYFVINLFCSAVRLKASSTRYLKIRYEDLLEAPTETLARIGSKFDIDLRTAADTIDNNEPLTRGFIFNGNRMSMGKEPGLILRKSGKFTFDRTFKNAVIMLLNRVWY
jgi:hypothetical protein